MQYLIISQRSARLDQHENAVLGMSKAMTTENALWLAQIGASFLHMEEYSKARDCLERSLEIAPNVTAFVALFDVFLILGSDRDDLARSTLKWFPSHPQILLRVASWHMLHKRTKPALDLYLRVLRIDPEDNVALLACSSIFYQAQKFQSGLSLCCTLSNFDAFLKNNVASLCFGEYHANSDSSMIERGMAFMCRSYSDFPLDWRLSHNLGLLALKNSQYASASKFFATSYTLQEGQFTSVCFSETLLFLAVSLGKCGDKKAARFAFEKTIESDSSPLFMTNYILYLIEEGDLDLARESFAVLNEFGSQECERKLGKDAESILFAIKQALRF